MTKKTEQETHGRAGVMHEARMIMKDYPPLVHQADVASTEGQSRYLRFIRGELIVACAAALLSDLIFHLSVKERKLWGWALVVLLLLGLMWQISRLWKRWGQSWFEGRAVAESAKTLTWRFMMKVQPFHQEADLEQEFKNRLKLVLHSCEVCQPRAAGPTQEITQRMLDARGQSWEKRREFYVAARLTDQIRWYDRKAKYNAWQSRKWLWLSILAQMGAIGAAILATYNSNNWNFVPVVTTAGAAFVAWSQAKDFDELRESYRLAHDELLEIRGEQVQRAQNEMEFLDAVVNSEGAISREHTMWAAKSGSPVVWKIA